MAFIYVTGAPGSGKSTIQQELKSRGSKVYDIDDSQLGGAHNKASGLRVVIPPAHERPPKWYNEHEWRIDLQAIKKLKDLSAERTIVICGVAPDDTKIIELFDKIFYLQLDNNVLQDRIAARQDNDYGKNPNELAQILERKKKLDARYVDSEAIILDASISPQKLTDQILVHLARWGA